MPLRLSRDCRVWGDANGSSSLPSNCLMAHNSTAFNNIGNWNAVPDNNTSAKTEM
jgi:hypothetical protein